MFQWFHRHKDRFRERCFCRPFDGDRPPGQRGQVAVIMLVLIAAALILYAVVINFGRASQHKTFTMLAADAASMGMASWYASYAEAQVQETLGGEREKCGWTGLLGILLFIGALLLPGIFYFVTSGNMQLLMFLAAVAIIFAGGPLIIELTIIQPAIDRMWNEIMGKTLPMQDQFLEGGLLTAMRNSITDRVQVLDLHDLDNDGIFGPGSGDYVPRYSLYYTRRLNGTVGILLAGIRRFQDQLRLFVFGTDGLPGLLDPVRCGVCPNVGADDANIPCCPEIPVSDPFFPSTCDPCCLPASVTSDFSGEALQTRPTCCTASGIEACGNPATCGARTPWPGFPWVYHPATENIWNGVLSLSETLGRDDQHPTLAKVAAAPNWIQEPRSTLWPEPENVPGYYMTDATGFHPADERPEGVFPFFYRIADWGVGLAGQDYGASFDTWKHCHWCEQSGRNSIGQCLYPSLDLVAPTLRLPFPLLVLPRVATPGGAPLYDHTNPAAPAVYSGEYCVDGVNDPASAGPLLSDRIPNPPSSLVAASDACPLTTGEGGWKRGADRFCSNEWVYFEACSKMVSCGDPAGCECPSGGAQNWNEDKIDYIVYSMEDFYFIASTIIKAQPALLTKDVMSWYQDLAEFIEAPGQLTERAEPGVIRNWQTYTQNFVEGLVEWTSLPREDIPFPVNAPGYMGGSCADVWCVPPPGGGPNKYGLDECACVTPEEQATFDVNANEIRGDMEDVAACLRWNADNAQRFLACHNECELFLADPAASTAESRLAACGILPRSLVPGFCEIEFDPGDDAAAAAVDACLEAVALGGDCSAACAGLSDVTVGSGDTTVLLPGFNAPSGVCSWDTVLDPGQTITCPAGFDPLNNVPECFCSLNVPTDWTQCSSDQVILPPDPLAVPPPDPATVVTRFCSPTNPFYCVCGVNNFSTATRSCAATDIPLPGETMVCFDTPQVNCVCSDQDATTASRPCTPADVAPDETISCANPLDPLDCTCTTLSGSCGDTAFADTLAEGLAAAQGSCGDAAPGGFRQLLSQSIIEAENQGTKFIRRVEFLTAETKPGGVYGVGWEDRGEGIMDQAIAKRDLFLDAFFRIAAFIEEAAQPLIDLVTEQENAVATGDRTLPLSSTMVYVWQDVIPDEYDPRPAGPGNSGGTTQMGLWHAVKVEGRVNSRCNNNCGYSGGADPGMPRVRTYKKTWGLQRCYGLENEVGQVKMRVIRYDQTPDTSGVTFPDGTPIWQMRFWHPNAATGESAAVPIDSVPGPCQGAVLPELAGSPQTANAFMLDQPGGGCWNWVHQHMLSRGAESVSCAGYRFSEEGDQFGAKGMVVVPKACDAGFVSGAN